MGRSQIGSFLCRAIHHCGMPPCTNNTGPGAGDRAFRDSRRGTNCGRTATAAETAVTETATTVTTDAGSLAVDDGVFKIKAANGAELAGTELSFRVDDHVPAPKPAPAK